MNVSDREPVTLGLLYKDSVHNIVGVAESRTVFRNGCVRVSLDHLDKDGKITTDHFDEQDLDCVEPVPPPTEPKSQPQRAGAGGPHDGATRRADVT